MQSILSALRAAPAYRAALEKIQRDARLPGLNLPRAARLPWLAALQADLNRPLLLVTDRADHALQIFDELGLWLPGGLRFLFAEPNPLFYEDAAWGVNTRRERLQTLTALAAYHLPFAPKPASPPVIVASLRALMTRTMPRRDFLKACKRLQTGQQIAPDALARAWVEMGYTPVEIVTEPGQFSRRGGLLDIWPAAETSPLRLDFFGDEIDSLRHFDPATQRTLTQTHQALITPAREYLLNPGLAAPFLPSPEAEVSEFHLPLLHPAPASLLDYLPPRALTLLDDVSLLEAIANEVEEQAVKLRQESIAEGTLAENFPVPYLTWSELFDTLHARPWLNLASSGPQEAEPLRLLFGLNQRFAGRLKPFMEHLQRLAQEGHSALVVSRQAARLQELWRERGSSGGAGEAQVLSPPRFVEKSLSEGFWLRREPSPGAESLSPAEPAPLSAAPAAGEGLFLFTDSEIFGWERPLPRPRQRPSAEAPEAAFGDLRAGDFVVHVDFGIGRFLGLVQRTLEGHEREFLWVEYEKGDQIFVPVHQADRLTRYVGKEGPPALTRLGSQEWTNVKATVRESVQKVAEELLELYAKRQTVTGYAFQPDTAWQRELEESFAYVETPDQKAAIEAIKRDMEAPRPMDRLLCGDVGYGKTEVALRAAFKAVQDGKQVALLVPTTVLAQQHFETFQQRLAAFPVAVEMLSRFRSPREQNDILRRLLLGKVDILIGTHRLISADVEFKNLGLVIIDEEQRFGVTHKEHFKKLRTEVDVLTLTATPIPRTLYMALSGVRDISNLNTPPEERLPVITHVGAYSPRLARQAILREMERGGQVFFVHNRVQTIGAMRMHLQKLVPQARIGIGHGQMDEHQLAAVMHQFTEGQLDILLSTTIIESGLDIPNANTLIVDRADTFGLAQLYQLRGRVGRGAARAYAYFFRHRKLPPTPEGQERLEVIAENTQLGAGYSIAMRDLEIRGAGELLGTRQSGQIEAVGFHLYTRMLAAEVKRLKQAGTLLQILPPGAAQASLGLPPSPFELDLKEPVTVDLPLAVGIPKNYIPSQEMRLRLYRRLASLREEEGLEALAQEFADRFGPLPEMAQNLLYQMRVKLRADAAQLVSVSSENGQLALRFAPLAPGVSSRPLPDLGPQVRGGKNTYWCNFLKDANWQERLLETLDLLRGRILTV